MNSKQALLLHCTVFLVFTVGAFSLAYVIWREPKTIELVPLVVATTLLIILVPGSWRLYGGCPFTLWENRARKREGKHVYSEPCIDHYAYKWFTLKFPGKSSTYMILAILLLPLAIKLIA